MDVDSKDRFVININYDIKLVFPRHGLKGN